MQKKVLFVCMGNSCRSPMAEAIFKHVARERGLEKEWTADSAGTLRWNIGGLPEPRARRVLEEHGMLYDHLGRLLQKSDFYEFDIVFGMDYWNLEDLMVLAPADCKQRIYMLGEFDPLGDRVIRDPYFDEGSAGFEECFEQCLRCIVHFFNKQAQI